jgi:WD40 repeat protein
MATYYEDDTVSVLCVADGILIPRAIHAEKWRKIKRNLSIDHDEDGWGRRVRFSPDGKHLAELKMAGNSLILWDVNTGEKIKELDGVKGAARTLVFSPEGHCLGLSCTPYPEYDTIELWDEEKRACFTHSAHVDTVAMSPDGMCLATGGRDKTVKLWHVETQQCFQTLSGHIGRILSLVFSPDGTRLVSGGGDNWEMRKNADGTTSSFSDGDSPVDRTAKVWEVATGENIATLENSGMVRGVAFSPDGKCLATGANKIVTLWSTKTWQPIVTLDTVSFESLSFSPDGSRLVIGGTWPEQRIQIWDVETRELIVELSGHKSDVESFAFSPDSRLLASGGFDGVIHLWDMTPYL